MPSKDIKLSFNELKQLMQLNKAKRKKRRKAKEKSIKFEPIKNNPNMRNFVTQSFPNTGASILSREVDVLRGELNKKSNALISAGKPEESKEYKTEMHKTANTMIDNVIDGTRNIRFNQDNSMTISAPINFKTKSGNKPGPKVGSKNRAKIVEINPSDGKGDFKEVRFTAKKTSPPTMADRVEQLDNSINNDQPKSIVYIGDNIDVPMSTWHDHGFDDYEPDDLESNQPINLDDINMESDSDSDNPETKKGLVSTMIDKFTPKKISPEKKPKRKRGRPKKIYE